jgi:peptide/nickel transport system substrate-binding protein
MMFTQTLYSQAKWNESHWNNSRFDQLLVDARTELDPAKRKEMYLEMQTLINQDSGMMVPLFADFVDAVSTKIGVGELSGAYELDGERASERWWFKS